MSEEIFALDIGTRKVMGIVAASNEGILEIRDTEMVEHPSRPMFDGQIHSIEEVARAVKLVKNNLESRLGRELKHAGVAVAGRNLLTHKIKVTRGFTAGQEITLDIVRDLELEAVDKIISDAGKKLSQFYCVGYSPMYYELDGSRISSLIGHYAKSISAEVIVTLLPQVVLNGMFAVLERCNLEATNITLEPISAINAIIPSEMRNLNIILVDIGAGTSDLALTRDGVIFAYGMVPEAGDEIMERISEILLVDFSTAEIIKRSLDYKDMIKYEDIWGRPHEIDAQSLKQAILPSVKRLAESIAKVGLDLNAGAPQAVVAVGGGSLTCNLIEELSVSFGISVDRVGIRLPGAIKNIIDKTGKLTRPDAITPIGIAIMNAQSLGLRFMDIEVNSKNLRMLDFQQKKDIMGALTLYEEVNNKRLYPRPGLALTLKVNGELKIVKGTLGEPAKISLNGRPVSSLSEKVNDGDVILFEEAVDGKDAFCSVKELVEIQPLQVVFNQEVLLVFPPVTINGEEVTPDAFVPDRGEVVIRNLMIKDILKSKGIKAENLSERQILVNINNVPKILTQRNFTLRLNSNPADLDTELKENDAVEFCSESPTLYRIKDVVDLPENNDSMRINVDGVDIEVNPGPAQVFMNGQQVNPEEFLIDRADIKVYYLVKRQILLSDIFRYIEFDPKKAVGKLMKILVDDKPAGFTTPVGEGSRIKIIFEERI